MTQTIERPKCADCLTCGGCNCSDYKTSINASPLTPNSLIQYCSENPWAQECKIYEV
jgi:hypothetical protein